jgi:hypothetical protein
MEKKIVKTLSFRSIDRNDPTTIKLWDESILYYYGYEKTITPKNGSNPFKVIRITGIIPENIIVESKKYKGKDIFFKSYLHCTQEGQFVKNSSDIYMANLHFTNECEIQVGYNSKGEIISSKYNSVVLDAAIKEFKNRKNIDYDG